MARILNHLLQPFVTGTATLTIDDACFRGPFVQELTLRATFSADCRRVSLDSDLRIVVGPFDTPIGANTITITLIGGGTGSFDLPSGHMQIPITPHLDHSLRDIFVSDSDVDFALTTGTASSPSVVFTVTGSPLNRSTGIIILVGASRFRGGFLAGIDCSLILAGTLIPVP